MKNIEILVKGKFIVIVVNGKEKGDILISELAQIWPRSNKFSNWIIHYAKKPDYNSKQQREELLLPLAQLIEKYHPNVIDWFNTFKEVEGILNHNAESNYNFGNTEDDMPEVNDDIDEALNNTIEKEVDNKEIDDIIKRYLKVNNLPFSS